MFQKAKDLNVKIGIEFEIIEECKKICDESASTIISNALEKVEQDEHCEFTQVEVEVVS